VTKGHSSPRPPQRRILPKEKADAIFRRIESTVVAYWNNDSLRMPPTEYRRHTPIRSVRRDLPLSVGSDPASRVLFYDQVSPCEDVGIRLVSFFRNEAGTSPPIPCSEKIRALNADPAFNGILSRANFPYPPSIDITAVLQHANRSRMMSTFFPSLHCW